MIGSIVRPRLVSVLLALTTLATGFSASAVAAGRPDLVVSAVSAPAGATRGGTISVSTTTKNAGSGTAGASKTGIYLSKDAKRNQGDVKISVRKIGRLTKGKTSRGTSSARIPAGTSPGAYYVVACADDAKQVRESNERNNCRASRQLEVMGDPEELDLTPFGDFQTIDVTPTRDNSAAVTETITTAGGSITATGPSGTTYTAAFPKDALLSDAEITLTPITSVTGDPFGGTFVAAVDVEPEGLRFFKPVTLRIQAATNVPIDQRAPFTYRRDGEDFHLYPSDPDKPAYTFELTHANTYGLFSATPAAREEQLARNAEDPEDALEQYIAAAYDPAVSASRQSTEVVTEARARMVDYYKFVVRPMLNAAQTNSTLFRDAVQKWLSWERQVQLLGMEEVFSEAQYAELRTMFLNGFKNYVDATFERCLDHELAAIQELLALERQAQLLGLNLGNTIIEKMEKCATFELSFSSRMDDSFSDFFGSSGSTVTRVEALVLIPMNVVGATTAEAPSTMAEASGSVTVDSGFGDPCTYSLSPGDPGTFQIFNIGMELNVTDPDEDGRGESDPIVNFIHVDVGLPEEVQHGCGGGESQQWLASWTDHHSDANANPVICDWHDGGQGSYLTDCVFTGWEPSTTVGEIARFNIDHTIDSEFGWTGVETTRLVLRHTPQR